MIMTNKGRLLGLVLVTLLVGNVSDVSAQHTPQFGFYQFNPLSINPAYAGSRKAISSVFLHRSQWVGFKGAPMTQTMTVHAPIQKKSIGLGLSAANDKIGSSNTTWIYADFSYSIPLNIRNDKLAFGLKGGIDLFSADFNGLQVNDVTDATYLSNISSTVQPNVGFGMYYHGKKHFVGLSVPKILESKLDQSGDLTSTLKRHYYVMGGYVFKLNKDVHFKPAAVVKAATGSPINADINANFLFNEKIWVGAAFRTDGTVGTNFVFYVNQQFYIGYNFEYTMSAIRTYNYGSHELMIGFDITPKNRAYTSPRFF